MKHILNLYKEEIIGLAIKKFHSIENLEHIRTNMSAVYKCKFEGKDCILRILITGIKSDPNSSAYFKSHAETIIVSSQSPAFPTIYNYEYIVGNDFEFLIIIEEYFDYSFIEGIILKLKNNNENIILTVLGFLNDLLDLFIISQKYGFVSHRDLSFDNMMFDSNLNLKMIDLGSAKSEDQNTTIYNIPTPTKEFYCAPELNSQHRVDQSKDGFITSEIYTIGILTFSLFYILYKYVNENKKYVCGIRQWLFEKSSTYPSTLSKEDKENYTFFVLANFFSGDKSDKFYRILYAMVDDSVSSRILNYEIAKKHIGGVQWEKYI